VNIGGLAALALRPVACSSNHISAPSSQAGSRVRRFLYRVEIEVALDLLEPLGGVARRALQSQHLGAALRLVALKGGLMVGLDVQIFGKSDGAFERELGARADREVGRGGCVAEQHDIAARPPLAQDAVEVEPGRAAQVAGVGH
jgi:hypothetical protein